MYEKLRYIYYIFNYTTLLYMLLSTYYILLSLQNIQMTLKQCLPRFNYQSCLPFLSSKILYLQYHLFLRYFSLITVRYIILGRSLLYHILCIFSVLFCAFSISVCLFVMKIWTETINWLFTTMNAILMVCLKAHACFKQVFVFSTACSYFIQL